MHKKKVYPSHMEGQKNHGTAWNKCILVNEGQAGSMIKLGCVLYFESIHNHHQI